MNPLMNINNPQPNQLMQLITQFQQFKQSMRGKDPQAMLNSLVASGQVSQQQIEQAKQMANQFKDLLK